MPDGLEIRETSEADLAATRSLWADGEVMRFVGFPEGLHQTEEEMRDWLRWIEEGGPRRRHYSIYEKGRYCGEAFYEIDPDTGRAALDIKLKKEARGRGIAAAALRHAIGEAFANGASCAYVDPHRENAKALALYRRLGMTEKPLPPELYDPDYPGHLYFEIGRDMG